MQLCFECGQHAEYQHHVVPRSLGGTKTVPLCGECHAKAHHRNGHMSTSGLTKAALARKKEKREVYGEIPYGFDVHGASLVENAQEQETIARMKLLRKQGLSFQRVADTLNGENIPTKKGCIWKAMQISRVVKAA